jgi:photosystem II stability/assembly factor-like uncharacterized protein
MAKEEVTVLAALSLFLAASTAGAVWERQRNGTSENAGFPAVAAGDATHAYAAGVIDQGGNSQAVVFVTSTGGTAWMPSMPDTRMLAMYFAAWAPSGLTCYVGGMSMVFKTSNGGMDWTQSQHPNMVGLKPVLGIGGWGDSFVVATTGSEIFLSSDGAASWTPAANPLDGSSLNGVFFVNQTAGWISGGHGDYSDEGELQGYSEGGLVATTDGGATWTALTAVEEKAYGKPSFINPMEGWIVSNSMSGPALQKTTDGGATWETMPLPSFTEGTIDWLSQVVFFDRCEGFLIGAAGDANGAALFYTTDGGQTWAQQDTSWSQIEWPPEFPFPFAVFPKLMAMDFLDRSTGWITGNYEFIGRYTADGPGPDCGGATDSPDWEPSTDAGTDGGIEYHDDSGCGCTLVR